MVVHRGFGLINHYPCSSGSITSGKSQKPYGPYDVGENLMISQSSLVSPL